MARPRSDIRPRLIQSARDRFLNEGVDGASLRRIAQDAGTSIGMIYYYFPTKDDLFLGVVEDVYAGILADVSRALAEDVPVDQRIARLYARIGAMSEVEFTTIRIIVREALVSNERLGRLIERFSQGHLPLIAKTIHEGVAAGVLTSRHPLPLLIAAIGSLGIFPQVMRRLVSRESPAMMALLPEPAELARMLVEVLLRGVGAGEPGGGDAPR